MWSVHICVDVYTYYSALAKNNIKYVLIIKVVFALLVDLQKLLFKCQDDWLASQSSTPVVAHCKLTSSQS